MISHACPQHWWHLSPHVSVFSYPSFNQALTSWSIQIYAAMAEWATGKYCPQDFSANRYVLVYGHHLETLSSLEKTSFRAYSKLMATLYSLTKYVSTLYHCC